MVMLEQSIKDSKRFEAGSVVISWSAEPEVLREKSVLFPSIFEADSLSI